MPHGLHARMTRAILRGYDLTEPDQTHAVRLLGSVFHGYVSLEMQGFQPQRPRLAGVLDTRCGRLGRPAAELARTLTFRATCAPPTTTPTE